MQFIWGPNNPACSPWYGPRAPPYPYIQPRLYLCYTFIINYYYILYYIRGCLRPYTTRLASNPPAISTYPSSKSSDLLVRLRNMHTRTFSLYLRIVPTVHRSRSSQRTFPFYCSSIFLSVPALLLCYLFRSENLPQYFPSEYQTIISVRFPRWQQIRVQFFFILQVVLI